MIGQEKSFQRLPDTVSLLGESKANPCSTLGMGTARKGDADSEASSLDLEVVGRGEGGTAATANLERSGSVSGS